MQHSVTKPKLKHTHSDTYVSSARTGAGLLKHKKGLAIPPIWNPSQLYPNLLLLGDKEDSKHLSDDIHIEKWGDLSIYGNHVEQEVFARQLEVDIGLVRSFGNNAQSLYNDGKVTNTAGWSLFITFKAYQRSSSHTLWSMAQNDSTYGYFWIYTTSIGNLSFRYNSDITHGSITRAIETINYTDKYIIEIKWVNKWLYIYLNGVEKVSLDVDNAHYPTDGVMDFFTLSLLKRSTVFIYSGKYDTHEVFFKQAALTAGQSDNYTDYLKNKWSIT